MDNDNIKLVMQAGVSILMDAVLNAIQEDPHAWSMRPCPTCRTISGIIGKPFGCYEYQRVKSNG
jgi:hypothetical protein